MTRDEFEQQVYDINSLVSFCNEYDYYSIVEDIYSEDAIIGEIKDCDSLRDVDYLISYIDDFSEDYYYYNTNGCYLNVDDDMYDELFNDLIEAYEEDYGFDEDDDENDDEECEISPISNDEYIEIKADEFNELLNQLSNFYLHILAQG